MCACTRTGIKKEAGSGSFYHESIATFVPNIAVSVLQALAGRAHTHTHTHSHRVYTYIWHIYTHQQITTRSMRVKIHRFVGTNMLFHIPQTNVFRALSCRSERTRDARSMTDRERAKPMSQPTVFIHTIQC